MDSEERKEAANGDDFIEVKVSGKGISFERRHLYQGPGFKSRLGQAYVYHRNGIFL
jgi:hypothetical protein